MTPSSSSSPELARLVRGWRSTAMPSRPSRRSASSSTACPSRSSSPRHASGPCRCRRSPGASTRSSPGTAARDAPRCRDTPPCRASIGWSFGLISPLEQQLMVALSTFCAPFDTDAAVAVAGAIGIADGAVEHICRLVDVGLVHLDDDSGRYRMLNTVRQFCRERGAESGALARAEEAHARHVAAWCEDVGAGRLGLEHRPFLRRMPDVVAAMSWARVHDHEAAFRMCRGLAPVRSVLGHLTEFDATWHWLLALDEDRRSPRWADAVAGLLATATSLRLDTAPAAAAVLDALTDDTAPARRWLDRGGAMVPAYLRATGAHRVVRRWPPGAPRRPRGIGLRRLRRLHAGPDGSARRVRPAPRCAPTPHPTAPDGVRCRFGRQRLRGDDRRRDAPRRSRIRPRSQPATDPDRPGVLDDVSGRVGARRPARRRCRDDGASRSRGRASARCRSSPT